MEGMVFFALPHELQSSFTSAGVPHSQHSPDRCMEVPPETGPEERLRYNALMDGLFAEIYPQRFNCLVCQGSRCQAFFLLE